MSDKWDKYMVNDNAGDKWGQYAVQTSQSTPMPKTSPISGAIGAGLGIGGAALGGYGLYRSGIPQAVGRTAVNIGGGVMNLPKVLNAEKGTKFAQEIRGEFLKAYKAQINKFGSDIAKLQSKYPERSVDLSSFVSDLQTNPELSKQAISVFKKTPKLDNILNNPSLAKSVSLKDAQDIVNHLNTKVSKNIRANNFDLVNGINDIKVAQLEAFPEIAKTRKNYAPFIENYKNIKPYLRWNKLLDAIKNRFGGAEGQVAAEKILPKEAIRKIKNYRTAAKLSEIPGDIPLVGRTLRSLGGVLSFAPIAFEAWKYSQDPGAFVASQFSDMSSEELRNLKNRYQQGKMSLEEKMRLGLVL